MRRILAAVLLLALASLAVAQDAPKIKWVVSWAASVHGPYPVGNPSAQPVLRFAFPSAETGARDQTLRLIVQLDIWGAQTRLRLSNAMGTKPVTFDGVFAGLQMSGAAIVAGTNRPVSFGGKSSVTVAPRESVWSDGSRSPLPRRVIRVSRGSWKFHGIAWPLGDCYVSIFAVALSSRVSGPAMNSAWAIVHSQKARTN